MALLLLWWLIPLAAWLLFWARSVTAGVHVSLLLLLLLLLLRSRELLDERVLCLTKLLERLSLSKSKVYQQLLMHV